MSPEPIHFYIARVSGKRKRSCGQGEGEHRKERVWTPLEKGQPLRVFMPRVSWYIWSGKKNKTKQKKTCPGALWLRYFLGKEKPHSTDFNIPVHWTWPAFLFNNQDQQSPSRSTMHVLSWIPGSPAKFWSQVGLPSGSPYRERCVDHALMWILVPCRVIALTIN